MLYNLRMPVNLNSGRVVVDIDRDLKLALHEALLGSGMSLKEWFVRSAQHFVSEHRQPSLFPDTSDADEPDGSEAQ